MLPRERLRLFNMRDPEGRPMRPEEMPTVRALNGERLQGSSSVDELLRTFGSRDLELSVTAAPLVDDTGSITGGVAVLRDVTERRKLERQTQELARLLEATFDAMTDAVLVYDATGRIIRVNQAVNTLFGETDAATFAALSLEERSRALLAWDEAGRPIVGERRAVPRLLRGEILRGDSAADERIRTLDGRDVWTSFTGAPIRDANGAIT